MSQLLDRPVIDTGQEGFVEPDLGTQVDPKTIAPPKVGLRVLRGAHWLDDVRPGWYWRVNPDTIDLTSPDNCVLGQTFGFWRNAPGGKTGHPVWMHTHGFMGRTDGNTVSDWQKLIEYRRLVH